MTTVKKKHRGESFESMFRRFKKLHEKADIITEVRKREYYEKSSASRKRAKEIAAKKEQKRQEDQRLKRFSPR